MYPATNSLSSRGRIRTVALAATIALGTLLPSLATVQAQADTGFDVTVSSAADLSGLTATVTGSDDGLNLRAEPSHESEIIDTLADNTRVDLLIDRLDTVRDPDGATRWWPISVGGIDGWVSGYYLTESVEASATEGDGTASATPDPVATTSVETSANAAESFTFNGTSLSGAAARVNGSGESVNMRAEPSISSGLINTLSDGAIVDLRIDTVDTVVEGETRWWPISIGGQDGWVSGFFLADSADTSAAEIDGATAAATDQATATMEETSVSSGESFSFNGDSLSGATARVAGSGESVNMRAEPSVSSSLVNTLSDGAIVDLRIDLLDTVVEGETRWWPISIAGQDGWVSGFFLTANDGTSMTASAAESSTTIAMFAAGQYVQAFTGDGDGVNLRADFSPAGALLEILSEGTVIQVMEGPLGFENSVAGWFKVTSGGVTGYVDGDMLRAASQPASPSDSATSVAFSAGDFALVQTQTQAGARIRSGSSPTAERTGFVPESGVVEIVSGPASFESSVRGWYEISFEGQTGFVDGDLLFRTDPPVVEAPVVETPVVETPAMVTTTGSFAAGEVVVTNSATGVGVNVRVAPGTGSDRVGFLADLSALEIVEGPQQDPNGDDWYRVSNGAIEGWISGNLLDRPEDVQRPSNEQSIARFIAPLADYVVTQNFGCSSLPYYSYNAGYGCNLHDGIDLATSAGSPLQASGSGTVVFSGWCDCGLGYYVEIDHGDGIHTVYGHMQSQPPVAVGQAVNQGDVIGPLGSSGTSTGPHVHFMVRVNGTAEDPRNYMGF